MTDDSDKRGEGAPLRKETRQDSRHERLKLALRDNLKRRKSQAKARDDRRRNDRERDDRERNDKTHGDKTDGNKTPGNKTHGKMTDAPSNHHEDELDDDTGHDRGE
jgi:hypothetical protein